MYTDEMRGQVLLALSGIQHFAFCQRQWALIHIEQFWEENVRTVEGKIMHERAHNDQFVESRGNMLILHGLRIENEALGLTGVCDVVEFHRDPGGIKLFDRNGHWLPYPVEYKRGQAKESDCDKLQLCAQAMCLEGMFLCKIQEGSLYYGETRRRQKVLFTSEMREQVQRMAAEMHEYYVRQYTPSVKPTKSCSACSLKDLCLPKLKNRETVSAYIHRHMGDEQ